MKRTWLLMTLSLLAPAWGHAYRPFESTDADVADAGELEIELGYLTFERSANEDSFSIPQAVVNYGLTDSLEIIGEFDVVHAEGERSAAEDVGLFLKNMLRRGVLQEARGVSIAIEGGLLLPARGSEQVGLEAIGIVSGLMGGLTWHITVGGGVDRIATERFAVWGAILEYPLNPRLRVVGELAAEKPREEPKESSVLVGLIWESETGNAFDGGLRRGISSAAADWQLTLGWTFSFPRE